ncbi:MlaA family lipoprotein [Falsiruegeria mediterranea]|jgi:phospholipid-binding lipoprotein MlaA|uniref:Putative phospholipid-binding lipoprotein MlaA n=1 Tax=Falsiruegeria mediterranea M17 TaxID=1200281 RepID=A0A2R8CD90_9RHOB|nr:VacJ family lipoprotein [Falsiruegeria mediterranea]SPJ30396.1 putative phospholipid-binding lipoprotein MlaA [Falsiruegeria mediterranea M17]
MTNFAGTALRLCIMALALVVAGCAQTTTVEQANGAFYDPYENGNRSVHSFNLGVDKFLFRPASKGYVSIIPDPMVTSFNSFAENISLPGQAVDYLLQGKPKETAITLYRFLINSTVGFAGLADPATDFKVPQVDTDFGETLHVWGVGEGPYLELPLYGPSTTRDAVGVVVNLFTNPLDFAPTRPIDNLGLYTEVVRRMGDRGRFSDTVDSILYESADSYAQARLIYLQNRRFELAGDDEDAYLGLYADPYSDPYSDASDPYEDPYAE